ncbi:DUF1127 domain-containing protein [Actibacterium pelagium]|uniref:YjiS-like domain-containing protein n=1 Tax=Actibacterium pelagium TaxID=2029103 RepID=A0A917EFX8_9RHOB|nr:DUF1127 domain-containing protein [Actibacterium pelagium]GGE36507.1 hypothetical protein GCM10011517_00320 [Actibacterium pelagium]
MATSQFSSASRGLNIVDRVFIAIDALATSVRQYYDYHRTVKVLSKLTARELDDLGLNSLNVESEARKLVYGN